MSIDDQLHQLADSQGTIPSTEALLRFAEGIKHLSEGYVSAGAQLAAAAEIIRTKIREDESKLIAFAGLISPSMFPHPDLSCLSQLSAVVSDRIGGMDLAQEITGKARSTLYNLVAQGKLPVAKNGGRLQFSEAALRAYSFQPRSIQALGKAFALKSNSPTSNLDSTQRDNDD